MLHNEKIIIVAGASGLIGKSIVDRIRQSGNTCIEADIQYEDVIDEGRLNCNITDASSVEQVFETVFRKYGRIDGVVNTAYPRTSDWGSAFENIPLQSWQKNVDMQLNSVFIICQNILERMKKQGFGSVVNLTSIYGVVGPDFSVYEGTPITMPAAYAAIKGGVINFTRYLASYYGAYNIRVNCVSPGGIFDNQNPVFVSNYERKVPMKRMGTPADIAGPVNFLLSDDSSYITGQNLIVDGGWTTI